MTRGALYSGIMTALALLSLSPQAQATCVKRCQTQLLDKSCKEVDYIRHYDVLWRSGKKGPRLRITCFDYCSTQGRRGKPKKSKIRESELTYRDVTLDVKYKLKKMSSSTCRGSRVFTLSKPLDPTHRYHIQPWGMVTAPRDLYWRAMIFRGVTIALKLVTLNP
jgi:hypothetical protein